MVRTKSLSASFGRKQRIEGIVKNLSAKAHSSPSIPDENQTESVSVLEARERSMDTLPNRSTPLETVSYELPVAMQFFGIIAAKQLPQGQRFGPFPGSIAQTVDPSMLSYSYISQIPDVEGNDYCLNLYKASFASSKWLNCLERCTSHGEYNIVAYNTPTGIFLQTVRDVVPGQQLCVAYDHSYDLPQVLQTPIEASPPSETFQSLGSVAEPFVNLRATVGPEFLARIQEQRAPACVLQTTNQHDNQSSIDNHVSIDSNDTETSEDIKPTYNVMTADVSETYYPPINDSKNRVNEEVSRNVSEDKEVKNGRTRMFKCNSCKKGFNTVEERHNHMETEHTSECPICKKVYTTSYLKEHMTFHNESSRVTCGVCSKVFSSISNLRKHERKHEKQEILVRDKRRCFKCTECPESFNNPKLLEIHRKKHVRIVPIQCNDCGEVFAQKNLLRRHQAVVHKGIRPFSCKYCEKTFTQRGNLARHCRQAHAEKTATDNNLMRGRFLCRRRGCNQASFASRELYIQHLQQHSADRRVFSCADCKCVFSSAGNLGKHRKTVHSNTVEKSNPTKYQCTHCQRPFQNHFQLNRHMRIHKEEKNDLHKCDHCGKLFMTRSGLSKHKRYLRCSVKKEQSSLPKDSNAARSNAPSENKVDLRSTREMRPVRAARENKVSNELTEVEHPFSCTTCGETFTSAWYLKVHRRTHKNYHIPCQLCDKKFSHVTNLAKHMRYIHQEASGVQKPKQKARTLPTRPKVDGEKSELTCEKCNKKFANVNSLAVHRQLHFGVKPFKCEFCETRFTQKSNMKRHLGTCKIAKEHSQNSSKSEKASTKTGLGASPVRAESSGRIPEAPASPVF